MAPIWRVNPASSFNTIFLAPGIFFFFAFAECAVDAALLAAVIALLAVIVIAMANLLYRASLAARDHQDFFNAGYPILHTL